MQRSSLAWSTVSLAACAFAASAVPASAQQTDLAVSPFLSFLPTGGASPLAGLALTIGGTSGLALRASGNVSLENSNSTAVVGASRLRPWGADADALLVLGRSSGGSRSLAPYLFAGVGTRGGQTTELDARQTNWSYGAGASLPLAGAIDIFGEARWRMPRFVLPSADNAPSPTNEFRAGVTFHVGRY